MSLPRKRATPRRAAHPVRPAWEAAAPAPTVDPPPPGVRPRRPRPKRSPEQVQRRADRAEARDAAWEDFKARVLAGTPGGFGDCAGTPWCPSAPHRGHTAHHVHQRSLGGTNHTSNGLWLCALGHAAIDHHIAESYRLGLLASTSEPWPPTPTKL